MRAGRTEESNYVRERTRIGLSEVKEMVPGGLLTQEQMDQVKQEVEQQEQEALAKLRT